MTAYKSPTSLNYKPGGFTNQGSTPGIIPQSKPQQQASAFNPSDSSTYMSKMSIPDTSKQIVKKTKVTGKDGSITEHTFDIPKTDTSIDKPVEKNTTGGFTQSEFNNLNQTGNIKGIIDNKSTPPQSTSPDKTTTPVDNSYSGLVGGNTTLSQGNISIGDKAQQSADYWSNKYNNIGQAGIGQEMGQKTTGSQPVGAGTSALTAAATGALQQGAAQAGQLAQTGFDKQLTAQNQAQTGLLGGAALTPEALRYGGAGGVSGISPQNDIENLATSLANGTAGMGYDQAYKQLSDAYGAPIANQLLKSIQTKNPNFNVSQSNAQISAQLQNTQNAGTTSALVDAAGGALDNLQTKFDALSPLQKTGGNLLGSTVGNISNATGIGATATRDYQAQLDEARAKINSVLNSAISLGIVKSGITANSILPDNMSKEGLTTAISTAKTLMQQTKDALAKLSNASAGSNTSTNSGTPMFGSFN